MAQIKFDSQALGVTCVDTEGTYVGGPVARDASPLVMRRKFIGDASQKVVSLADIYRVPRAVDARLAENVNTGNIIKFLSDRI
jgi:hypothetical protein